MTPYGDYANLAQYLTSTDTATSTASLDAYNMQLQHSRMVQQQQMRVSQRLQVWEDVDTTDYMVQIHHLRLRVPAGVVREGGKITVGRREHPTLWNEVDPEPKKKDERRTKCSKLLW